MPRASAGPEMERLVALLAKLPGLGPRSAKRAALAMLKKRDALMTPLAEAMRETAERVAACSECGNLDSRDPCGVCTDPEREARVLCVVEDVADLWALERAGAHDGRYHVLGGLLSALEGVGPEDLSIDRLAARAAAPEVEEVVLALSATVDGQTTAHYLAERLAGAGATLTHLAQGVPVGGALDHLDDGTLAAAMKARRGR